MGGVIIFHCFTIFLLCFFTLLTFFPIKISSSDTISSTESLLKDQTLVSSNDVFELGFFTPDHNPTYYLGIWYKNIPARTYVWVANRDAPLSNSSCVFRIGEAGRLVISDQESSKVLWSANQTTENSNPVNLVAQLLDSGNLVLRDEKDEKNYLWQSFDYPTDTLLPGMKLGWDLDKKFDRFLTSWKSPLDPSSGSYSFELDFHGYPEAYLYASRVKQYRSGPWNGLRFSGVPEMKSSQDIYFAFESSRDEVYYSYYLNNPTLISRLVVNSTGFLQRFTWVEDSQYWSLFWYARKDQCDDYMECGPFGICDTNASPVCNCTIGFKPKNPEAWDLRDGSDGCVRVKDLDCGSDGFLQLSNMKLPDSSSCFVDVEMRIDDCRKACAKNCSCTGYSSRNISDGSGCVMWFGDLVDMRHYTNGYGQDFFVRLSASDIAAYGGLAGQNEDGQSLGTLKIVAIVLGCSIFLLGVALLLVWKKKNVRGLCCQQTENKAGLNERSQDFLLNEVVISSKREYSGGETNPDFELPLFNFNTIALATDNFSDEKKLGQGGFGIVYKGQIEGQEIAVKRLSKNSGQGKEEFKNEVQLIARLQHRNLVRLLGCCVDMDEKILVYEYMEHRSLDSILFHKSRSSALNWQRRFNIILGIARGLLYLHQDSRFRIIHRDLKASNILLDKDMTPKISDFGMARIFGTDQVEANTRRVVGTYGYMSPEYAMDGLFSVKSDVFSFGVLVLEIVSGKKNRGFYYSNNELNLLGHAWRLWKEGMSIELIDSAVGNSCSKNEVLRCIQVGLLCVQEHAEDRPTMSSVVLMLSSDPATTPHPKNPGFCLGRQIETDSSSSKHDETCTVNNVTVTILDAR